MPTAHGKNGNWKNSYGLMVIRAVMPWLKWQKGSHIMKSKLNHFGTIGATGFAATYLPPGDETDDVLRLLRQGKKFDRREGKSPGFFHKYITSLVAQIPQKPTFEGLLVALELEAVRRDRGEPSPIERVSRSFEIIKFRDKKGEHEISFGTLGNYFTAAKKENSREPLNRENDLPQCDMLRNRRGTN